MPSKTKRDGSTRQKFLANGVPVYSKTQLKKKTASHKKKLPAKGTKTAEVAVASVGALRASIQPGSVLILLAGAFRGKRVVFLKRLESGLLLVTGPFKLNGVPLRRVNQRYVIATSTVVDISKVVVPADLSDASFQAPKDKATKSADAFLEKKAEKHVPNPKRVEQQIAVDTAILAAVKSTPLLKEYLQSRFSLSKNDFPHQMKF